MWVLLDRHGLLGWCELHFGRNVLVNAEDAVHGERTIADGIPKTGPEYLGLPECQLVSRCDPYSLHGTKDILARYDRRSGAISKIVIEWRRNDGCLEEFVQYILKLLQIV